ncbi:MAG: DUF2953 domain-containing protein [Dehalococcoidia bacterium]|nr:DUF2953 domain-containing protein [Dehalococcoidia bacterium]
MWIVIALCILIALTILLMCVPVDFRVRVESWGEPKLRFRLEWLFGRVGKSFRAGEAQEQPARSAEEEKKQSGKKKKEKSARKRLPSRDSGDIVWRIINVPGLRRSIERLVRRLLRSPRVRLLYADIRVGLDDPADTALVIGPLSQAAMFADMWSPYSFRVTPVFGDTAMLEGEGALDVRLYPIRVIVPVVAFLFSLSTIRVIVLLVRWRCRRK